jgi:SAM-dependent methyltransferase
MRLDATPTHLKPQRMLRPQGGDSRHHARRTGSEAVRYLYPEIEAGGFTRYDHRVIFFARVNALLRKDMKVLDFGAGRGKWAEIESGFRLDLMTLKGKCERLIGADIDPAVLDNPLVDEAVVLPADGSIPLPDMSVDIVVSWAVFEHIMNPAHAAAELFRILRPGGWICAWTPNKWSYTSIGARIIPNQFHTRVLRYVHPTSKRREHDVFPTFYRLNTLRELRRHFPTTHFEHFSYRFSGPPSYHANKLFLAVTIDVATKLAPNYFAQTLHVFIRKRKESQSTRRH